MPELRSLIGKHTNQTVVISFVKSGFDGIGQTALYQFIVLLHQQAVYDQVEAFNTGRAYLTGLGQKIFYS